MVIRSHEEQLLISTDFEWRKERTQSCGGEGKISVRAALRFDPRWTGKKAVTGALAGGLEIKKWHG